MKRETELGPPVVAWLQGHGLDLYQEVAMPRGHGGRADLVGTAGRLVVVSATRAEDVLGGWLQR